MSSAGEMAPATPGLDEWYYALNGQTVGPVSATRIRDMAMFGQLTPETLLSTSAFGDDWKPLRDTALMRLPPAATAAPAATSAPGAAVSDFLAWVLVAIPVVGTLIELVIEHTTGAELSFRQTTWVYCIPTVVIAVADAKQINKGGHNVRDIYLTVWAILLVPVYLIQRSRALGRSFVPFFAWLASFVAALAIVIGPALLSGRFYWGVGIPSCNSFFSASQAKSIFGTLQLTNGSPPGVQAVELLYVTPVSSSHQLVSCRGAIIGDDGKRYMVSFTHEPSEDRIVTRLRVDSVE